MQKEMTEMTQRVQPQAASALDAVGRTLLTLREPKGSEWHSLRSFQPCFSQELFSLAQSLNEGWVFGFLGVDNLNVKCWVHKVKFREPWFPGPVQQIYAKLSIYSLPRKGII